MADSKHCKAMADSKAVADCKAVEDSKAMADCKAWQTKAMDCANIVEQWVELIY